MLNKLFGQYTLDGVYFGSIEEIGNFPVIINLKNAINQENKEEAGKYEKIL